MKKAGDGITGTMAFPSATWEREKLSIDVLEAFHHRSAADEVEDNDNDQYGQQDLKRGFAAHAERCNEMHEVNHIRSEESDSEQNAVILSGVRWQDNASQPNGKEKEACDKANQWQLSSEVDSEPPSKSNFEGGIEFVRRILQRVWFGFSHALFYLQYLLKATEKIVRGPSTSLRMTII